MTSGPSKQRWLSALGGRNEGVFPHHCGTELCKHQDSRQPGSGTQGLPENNRHISSFHSVTVNGFSHGTLQLMWFLVSFIGHGELQRIVREDGGPNSAVLSAQWMPSGALIFQPWTSRIWCSTASTTVCHTNLDFRCGRKAGGGRNDWMVNVWSIWKWIEHDRTW